MRSWGHGAENCQNRTRVFAPRRAANPGKPVYLHKICSQRDVILPSPPVKEKSPELVARLAKLQAELDNKRCVPGCYQAPAEAPPGFP